MIRFSSRGRIDQRAKYDPARFYRFVTICEAAVDAVAEALPFADASFDASMATFTVHQWADLAAGLAEMRRVTRGPALVLTCDPDQLRRLTWLVSYLPEVIAVEAGRYPPIDTIARALGERSEIISVPIPFDCTDGFTEAYYGRPECLLDAGARQACSAWSFLDPRVLDRFTNALSRDLASGAWDATYGYLRSQSFFEGSLKLIVGRSAEAPV